MNLQWAPCPTQPPRSESRAQPYRRRSLLQLLNWRPKPPRPQNLTLQSLPALANRCLDMDFLYWPMPARHLLRHSSMFVLSSWWSKITPLPTARKEIQLTELPYMIRLLSFGDDPSQCHSILDEGRDNRKARIKDCLNAVGSKVGLNNFTGLVAKTKQTIWGPHLIQALEDA